MQAAALKAQLERLCRLTIRQSVNISIRPAGGFVVFYPAGAAVTGKSGSKRQAIKPRPGRAFICPAYRLRQTPSLKHTTARPPNHPPAQNVCLIRPALCPHSNGRSQYAAIKAHITAGKKPPCPTRLDI